MARRAQPPKRLRIRSKRLDQLDETKLALALWLMAKDMLADKAADQPSHTNKQVVPPADVPAFGDTDNPEAA